MDNKQKRKPNKECFTCKEACWGHQCRKCYHSKRAGKVGKVINKRIKKRKRVRRR